MVISKQLSNWIEMLSLLTKAEWPSNVVPVIKLDDDEVVSVTYAGSNKTAYFLIMEGISFSINIVEKRRGFEHEAIIPVAEGDDLNAVLQSVMRHLT